MGNLVSGNDKKKLIIIRGLPGSGKSTFAKKIAKDDGLIISADDYFITDGEYKFTAHKLKESHQWAQNRAKVAMEEGHQLVVIDNTNVRKWEAKPYVKIGVENDYDIEFIEVDTPWARDPSRCYGKDSHGVPLSVIEKMDAEWENDFTVDNILNSHAPWEK